MEAGLLGDKPVQCVTGTPGTTATNGAGIHVFTELAPGHFRLQVRKEGFKEVVIKEFELQCRISSSRIFRWRLGR